MRGSLHYLPSSSQAAGRLARRLDLDAREIALHRFPDEELRVTVSRATPTTIVFASLDRPNDKLLALLFAAEALRRGGARRLVLVAPYLCYMRQDTAFREGEAISQRVVGSLLAGTFDRIVTVEAHLHRTRHIEDVFGGQESDNLSAMPAIADFVKAGGLDPATIVVGPDEESERWVGNLAGLLGIAYTVARKTRHDDRSVEIAFGDAVSFNGRPVLLVDDIVSSGGTLAAVARVLTARGARSIDAIVVHALFAPDLVTTLFAAGIRSLRSSDSVPHPSNAITLDAIFADALRKEWGP